MQRQPLAQSRAEQALFVDREEETRAALDAIRSSQPVLVLGERGGGKTSFLNHVAWILATEEPARRSILLSGEAARSPAQLLGVLITRVGRLSGERRRAEWLQDLQMLSTPDGPFGEVVEPAILMELVDLMADRLAELDVPVCLMIDGLAPDVAHGLFGTLRNELWELEGANWVVAGDNTDGDLYLEPPADAFFERVIELGPFSDADSRDLIRAHAPKLGADDAARAVVVGRGNPSRLLRAASEISAGKEPTDVATDDLARRAGKLAGPLAGRIVEHLAADGPAAASDETLQRSVGASRQRLAQLMTKLETDGILRSMEHREPGRRGRPARRFAVNQAR